MSGAGRAPRAARLPETQPLLRRRRRSRLFLVELHESPARSANGSGPLGPVCSHRFQRRGSSPLQSVLLQSVSHLIREAAAMVVTLAAFLRRDSEFRPQAAWRNASSASYSESCTSNTVSSLVTCIRSPTRLVRLASLIVEPALCAVVCSATSVPSPPESM
jgi:hypothetical protein